MQRKLLVLLMFSFILLGCESKKEKGVTTNEPIPEDIIVVNEEQQEKEPIKEEDNTPVKTETFLKENYISFPKIKNIVHYLKPSPKKVKIISQTSKKLVFCFYEKDVDVHDESILSSYNYVKLQEKDGYKMNLYDSVMSSTFVLEKGDYKIPITGIGLLDEWKEVNKDEMDTTKITTENTVCQVSVE